MIPPNLPLIDEDTAQILIRQFVKELGYEFVKNCATDAYEDQKYEERKEANIGYTTKVHYTKGRDW